MHVSSTSINGRWMGYQGATKSRAQSQLQEHNCIFRSDGSEIHEDEFFVVLLGDLREGGIRHVYVHLRSATLSCESKSQRPGQGPEQTKMTFDF